MREQQERIQVAFMTVIENPATAYGSESWPRRSWIEPRHLEHEVDRRKPASSGVRFARPAVLEVGL